MPRFAANLSFLFTEVDFLDRFSSAADAGFTGVEYPFPYAWPSEELVDRLQRKQLTQVLLNLPPGNWEGGERGLAALPGREGEFQDSVGTALDYAKALGCDQLHAMAGIAPDGASREHMQRTYVDNLRFAARAAAQDGIRVLIEAINTHDMPGYFLTHSRQALQLIDEVASDNLFFQYDIYHMQIMEGNLTGSIVDHIDRIAHFQLAGVPGRHEPSVGEIHYPYLFDLIDELGYDGWVGCEYRPQAGTRDGLGWARAYGIGD